MISLLTLTCHQAEGQKEIFTKDLEFLGDHLAFDT